MQDDVIKVYNPQSFDQHKKITKKTVEEIEKEALQRAKTLEEEGFRKGYQEGLKKAEEETKVVLEDEKKKIDETCQKLLSVLQSIDTYRSQLVKDLLPDIITLSVEIAEKIVKKEIELDKNIVSYIAQEALSKVEDTVDTVTIKVNPIDYDIIVEHLNILKDASSLKTINIEPVSTIERGGCIIETEKGEIDARISEQLVEIADAVSTATHRDM
ncbi:MAG: FliH/SctL family protein [Thermodesulfovibrionales bacterium]|nr:FliH/SctL family protein [Thermodesulfovibrionales bacterium]